jgi:hypothetical protein
MHANVTSGEIQAGQVNDFLNIYQNSVKPVVEAIPGLKNLYVLTDNDSSKAMVIAIYGSKEEAENAQQDGHFQEALGKLASTLVLKSVSRDSYDVSIQI